MNQAVRSRFTPPERDSFKPAPLRASSNSLNYRASDIRTKMAVVRLRRRKWAERDRKRPEMGLAAAARGSDKWPQMPAFCAVPPAHEGRKKNVPTDETGGGSGIRTHGTLARTTVFETAPFDRSGIPPRHRSRLREGVVTRRAARKGPARPSALKPWRRHGSRAARFGSGPSDARRPWAAARTAAARRAP
jgi:hypothetical protein